MCDEHRIAVHLSKAIGVKYSPGQAPGARTSGTSYNKVLNHTHVYSYAK